MLILQIIIRQWDKSQRTAAHIAQRAALPNAYPLTFPPAVYLFENQCILDQQGDDIQGGRVTLVKTADNTLMLDRFRVSLVDKTLHYCPETSDAVPNSIATLDNQWVQCKYRDRRSILESGYYYWLYEDVTLNVLWANEVNEHVFLNTEPVLVFNDPSTL